jgi:4a-hydroxytetrahydrobiopterin dehydratase
VSDESEDVMATLMDDAALQAALETLQDWHGDRTAISRSVHAGGASEVDDLLAKLEKIAREMNHDPDTAVSDGDVTITMSTHSAGGVTELDVAYARRVDDLLR